MTETAQGPAANSAPQLEDNSQEDTTPDRWEKRTRQIVDEMLGPNTEFSETEGEVCRVDSNPSRQYDVFAEVQFACTRDLRNSRSLERYEFTPSFSGFHPTDHGSSIEISGEFRDYGELGIVIHFDSENP